MLSEISQMEEDKYHRISFVWGHKKERKGTNQTEANTDTENRVVVIKGEGVGGCEMGTGAQLYCDR